MTLSETTQNIQVFITQHPRPSELSLKELSDIYTELIDCLIDHNHLYYVEASPIISDKEYDDLFAYLKKIEESHPEIISSNSPTQSLVGQVSDGFGKANHKEQMLSLENTYNAEDLMDRDKRVRKILEPHKNQDIPNLLNITYIIEPKFDGLSIELLYENTKLTK